MYVSVLSTYSHRSGPQSTKSILSNPYNISKASISKVFHFSFVHKNFPPRKANWLFSLFPDIFIRFFFLISSDYSCPKFIWSVCENGQDENSFKINKYDCDFQCSSAVTGKLLYWIASIFQGAIRYPSEYLMGHTT